MIITRAPHRVSFFGGGTDYPEYFLQHGGAVLATAIDKYSFVTASPFLSRLFDYSIRVSYRKVELVKCANDVEHNVYRECLKYCGLDKDVELHTVSDLPSFTGLGSSSAFTVGLLQALHAFTGKFVSKLALAYEAIHIERNVLKDRVGCQDQTLAAVGGLNVLEFRREDDIVVHRLPISPARLHELEQHLLLVYTGVTRKANEVVAGQLTRLGQNLDTLAVMRRMVDEGADLLMGDRPITAFGELLHRAWQAKRTLDAGVSSGLIDRMYERAQAHGAVGGKLLGAGGGGFLLCIVPPDVHASFRQAFDDFQILQLKLAAPGSQVIFDGLAQ
jgi:D-glycero-alpha-D-manno-heptose-7-phosphate kinase